ncbi:MAG: hypothetical protein QXI32_00960 [Candidatus Bathyarchaeia archaeon]
MWDKRKIILLFTLAGILYAPIAAIPASCSSGIVEWVAEDTITKGDWLFNPKGSPFGTYGSCGHILPNAPQTYLETPIDAFSVPIGGYTELPNPPYNWAINQILGLPYHRLNPPYYDEYVPTSPPKITYDIDGTYYVVSETVKIQYPAFEYAWGDWHSTQTDPREVYYTMALPDTGGGPGWRLASWDDGGERCQPYHGYMNFTLTFPQGDYYLSLYAYDYERFSRWSQEYRIYDSTGTTLLASKQISGTVFDEGVYEIFRISAPEGGLTIILQVYNDAGHVGEPFQPDKTNNVVLSGIFLDCIIPRVGGSYTTIDSTAFTTSSRANTLGLIATQIIWAILPLLVVPILALLAVKILRRQGIVRTIQ